MRTRLGLLTLAYVLGELEAHAQEEGTNWGPSVSVYLRGAGVNVPAPWCAALMDWGLDRACELSGATNPLGPIKLEAYVQAYVDYARANNMLVPAGLARPGDFVCYSFGKTSHFDHIGILSTTVTNDAFNAIEGNTNDDGSREGYKVADKHRLYRINKTVFIAFDRHIPLVEGDFADVLSILDEYYIEA